MKGEILRKLIHLSSILYPLLYMLFLSKSEVLSITTGLFTVLCFMDFLRWKFDGMRTFFNKFLKIISRKNEEKGGIYGSTYFMAGVSLSILLFSKQIAIASILVLILADTAASIFGKLFGRKKLIGDKTIAGFIAFLFTAILVLLPFGNSFLLAAIPTAISELISQKLKIDDNLLIPLVCGLTCTIISYL